MAVFSKAPLSNSTDGKSILVAATTSPGTTIHTGPTNTSHIDEVWLYAANTSVNSTRLVIQWGGTASPNDNIILTLLGESGTTLVVPGFILVGNATPLVIRAHAGTTNLVTIHGYVNTIR